MTTPDPETGTPFSEAEMIDQVAVMFLAGHETSASVLAWALWLLAAHPDWQERVAAEAATLDDFASVGGLRATRAVFREALRRIRPLRCFVREATAPETFRDRPVPRGAQLVISPWHLHRHNRLWDRPDDFDPSPVGHAGGQGQRPRGVPAVLGRAARLPRRGAGDGRGGGDAGRDHRAVAAGGDRPPPMPIARLTIRARDGIWVRLTPR